MVSVNIEAKKTVDVMIEKADALKEADYTADSWKSMQVELAEAKELLAKEKPTQAEVDEATTHLNTLQQKQPEKQ